MISHHIVSLGLLVLLAVVATAQENHKDFTQIDSAEDIERGAQDWIIKQLKRAFSKINPVCLYEALERCGFNIKEFGKLSACAAQYFKENALHCINL